MAETNAAMVPVVENTEENELIDVLGRDQFVDNMVLVTEMLSAQKKNACYAINGSWGVGKSFVLELYERKIKVIQSEETASEKYMIFRYDCWKHDFYDEPLIAIVATLIETIDEKINLIPSETKEKWVESLRKTKDGFSAALSQWSKTKKKIDEVVNTVNEKAEKREQKREKQLEYDTYRSFNGILQDLRNRIIDLAKECTIVFIVDELDRCLPEYTIKVLERLHHVFDDVTNVQVILAVDREQLNHTIKQIYGKDTDTKKYLAKFVDFEMKLDEGVFNEKLQEETRFKEYIKLFHEISAYMSEEEVKEYYDKIFCCVEIRSRIAIIQRCKLLHEIMDINFGKTDRALMCIEIFLAVIQRNDLDLKSIYDNFDDKKIFGEQLENSTLHQINKKYQQGIYGEPYFEKRERRFEGRETYKIYADDIWGLLLKVYRTILGCEYDGICMRTGNMGAYWDIIESYVKAYWNLLQIIE